MPPRSRVIVRNKIKIKINMKIKFDVKISFRCCVHNDEQSIAKPLKNQNVEISLLSTRSTWIKGCVTRLPGSREGKGKEEHQLFARILKEFSFTVFTDSIVIFVYLFIYLFIHLFIHLFIYLFFSIYYP